MNACLEQPDDDLRYGWSIGTQYRSMTTVRFSGLIDLIFAKEINARSHLSEDSYENKRSLL